jgi:tRNA(fMet)-specific endonuclease VapC
MTQPQYLLDTNALIMLRDALRNLQPKDAQRQQRLDRLRKRCEAIASEQMVFSFISWGELVFGAQRSQNPAKARVLLDQLRQRVRLVGAPPQAAASPAKPQDNPQADALAEAYEQLLAQLKQAQLTMDGNDAWIAAHALTLGMTLVTNDHAFQRVPQLQCEDWTA